MIIFILIWELFTNIHLLFFPNTLVNMSIWDTTNNWAESYTGCSTVNQSPVNLSTDDADKCSKLCEFYMNDSYTNSATIRAEPNFLFLGVGNQTCSYNQMQYNLMYCSLYNPSQHTIEGTRYDAEFVMSFSGPSGQTLNVSVMVKSSNKVSASSKFFDAFVPYATNSSRDIQVNLGNNWSLSFALPKEPSYFVYEGSNLTPPCQANITWIVHRFPVNISSDSLAVLKKTYSSGFRPVQSIGKRKIVWNDGSNARMSSKTLEANDHRLYVVMKRVGEDAESRRANLDKKTPKTNVGLVDNIGSLEGKLKAPSEKTVMEKTSESIRKLHQNAKEVGYANLGWIALLTLIIYIEVVIARYLAKVVLTGVFSMSAVTVTGEPSSFYTNVGWYGVLKWFWGILTFPIRFLIGLFQQKRQAFSMSNMAAMAAKAAAARAAAKATATVV